MSNRICTLLATLAACLWLFALAAEANPGTERRGGICIACVHKDEMLVSSAPAPQPPAPMKGTSRPMEDRLSTARPQMRRVLERIEQSLSERLTIAGMAAWANMSPFHFAREFKRLTGMPPHHYVKTRRLHLSRQMLRASNLSIGEIAYRVGFLSPSHFSAEFRKVTGVKPADWRREQRSCGPNPQDPDTADLQETVSL